MSQKLFKPLKSIKSLKTSTDLIGFNQIREIESTNFFPSL